MAVRDNHKEEDLRKWAAEMVDCRNSSFTQEKWCHLNHIKFKTFQYHCQCVRAEIKRREQTAALTPVPFAIQTEAAAVDSENDNVSPILIQGSRFRVEVPPDISDQKLRLILEVMSHA